MSRLLRNVEARRELAGGRCEAFGLHHKDCPGWGSVGHHIYRRGDAVPAGLDRDSVELLRWVWNGPTTLGASGCHGRLHRNQGRARELGLLAPRPVHMLTLTPLGFWETSTGRAIPQPHKTIEETRL